MAYTNNSNRGKGYGGRNYENTSNGDKKSYGNKSYGDKPYGERKSYGDGEHKQYGDKPYEKKSYGDKPYGERKQYGDKPYEKKQYGDKPYGERKSYGDGERKQYGDKPYEKKSYGDKPYEKKSYGDKPYGERKSYGDKPYGERKSYGDGEHKQYGDKPYGERKQYGDKPYGERKSYGDKPYGERKSYGDKPYEKKSYGERRPYGERQDGEKTFERRPYDERKPVAPAEPAAVLNDDDATPYLIIGRNAVREAIKAGRSIDRVLTVTTEGDGSLREIVGLARDSKLVIHEVDRAKLDEVCLPFGHGGRTANHQGIVAYAAGVSYCEVEDILSEAQTRGEEPFVIVLDGVTDPQNLGSIIRSAEVAGAHGVIIGKRRSASVTAAAVKASAGATEHMKIARVVNLNTAIAQLKKAKLWIAGADMEGRSMYEQGLNGPLALVIGGEGEGLSALVKEHCDFMVGIPMQGKIGSLNAGVAAAVLMFEKRRQDAAAKV